MTDFTTPSVGKSTNGASAEGLDPRELAILRERAAQLARPLAAFADTQDDLEFVVFSVGDDRFAAETAFVREVLPLPEVTPLPGAARVFVGVTSLRGEIVPVAAFERLFGGLGVPLETAPYLLVLGGARAEIGVLATAVHELIAIDPAALSPAGRERALTRGVMRDGLVVLDATAVLNDPRLIVEDEASDG